MFFCLACPSPPCCLIPRRSRKPLPWFHPAIPATMPDTTPFSQTVVRASPALPCHIDPAPPFQ
eukprot:4493315-Alexandrium_andersonii.AAC.1